GQQEFDEPPIEKGMAQLDLPTCIDRPLSFHGVHGPASCPTRQPEPTAPVIPRSQRGCRDALDQVDSPREVDANPRRKAVHLQRPERVVDVQRAEAQAKCVPGRRKEQVAIVGARQLLAKPRDRKSTRLNSSHVKSSYAVFCSKKKTRSLSK